MRVVAHADNNMALERKNTRLICITAPRGREQGIFHAEAIRNDLGTTAHNVHYVNKQLTMNQPPGALVISYLTLRKAVGIIGIALPFVLVLGAMLLDEQRIQSSISSYYHTDMRDVFVGSLCAIAVFLISYRGYERKDDIAGDLACIFALGVALFPTDVDAAPSSNSKIVGAIHLAFGTLFFLTLAYFSLALFRKTDPIKRPTRRKLQRNVVYTVCGYTILACIGLIVLLALLPGDTPLKRLNPVFWLESVAVVAFGVSWLTKGEAILGDEET